MKAILMTATGDTSVLQSCEIAKPCCNGAGLIEAGGMTGKIILTMD